MTTFDNGLDDRATGASRIIWGIGLIVVVFVLWASMAWVAEIVRGEGQVVSSSRPQIIQNLEGGILAELSVAEGDVVEPGQSLGRLYGTQYQAAVDDLTDQIATLEVRKLRLEAESRGDASFLVPRSIAQSVPSVVASEQVLLTARLKEQRVRIEGAEAVLEQARTERELLEKMFKAEIAPLIEVTRARKQASDAEARLAEARTSVELDRASALAETQSELVSLRQRLKQSQDQLTRTHLTAPMRGIVNKVSVTTIGGVVRPGEEVMQIIPLDEELFVEARIAPRDIAEVRLGQPATIKLSAYDYTVYGSLTGTVTFVSADTFTNEAARGAEAEAHYKVTVAVDRSRLTARQAEMEIRPGMQATVELQTGGKTILTYLTRPLYKAEEALRER